jgi:rhamnogalacturonyl hydrolase YesR
VRGFSAKEIGFSHPAARLLAMPQNLLRLFTASPYETYSSVVVMNPRLLLVLFCMQIGCAGGLLRAADLPTPQPPDLTPSAVLSLMERVADWQLANPSKHSPTDWTQGAGYAGIMALARISTSPRFLDAMLTMAEANAWQLGPRPYHADDHCVGQTYVELFFHRHDPRMIAPMRERFDWILAHPKDDNLVFDPAKNPDAGDRWSWCDSLFMAPPAWARLYAATGKKAYLDFAVEKWWQTSAYLYDTVEHLYFRDSTYFERREANGKKIFWSRGNGWVMGGLVRVLQYLPADHPARPRFVQQYREMAGRILLCQQPDGLWRSSLLDPADYPLKETSGSGFYCYALAWGINQGLLYRETFEPAVISAWRGLAGCVTPEGKLTHVQPIGADPRRFDENATEVYGVGALLLAGSEVCHLLKNEP